MNDQATPTRWTERQAAAYVALITRVPCDPRTIRVPAGAAREARSDTLDRAEDLLGRLRTVVLPVVGVSPESLDLELVFSDVVNVLQDLVRENTELQRATEGGLT